MGLLNTEGVYLPAHIRDKLKTASPDEAKAIVEYFRRNDAEERRAQVQSLSPAAKVSLESLNKPSDGMLSEYIKRPSAPLPEYLKRPEDDASRYAQTLMDASQEPQEDSSIGQEVDISFIKEQENPDLKAGIVHESPEGGNDTIGWGHKLTDEEVETGRVYGLPIATLTEAQAEFILKKDIQKKRDAAARKLKKQYDVDWDALSPPQKHLFVDYEFNLRGGWQSFPTFFKAVLVGDKGTMLKEYKRNYKTPSGVVRGITKRNRATKRFIQEHF